MNPQPWFHEAAGPALFNEWTLSHFLWGLFLARYVTPQAGFVLHTVYELVEGQLFRDENRDTSWRNHVGDTAAFMAAWMVK